MAYIRAKKVNGIQYGYLVESLWDPEKNSSIQVTLKYLGKLGKITLNDLPEKYRSDPKIIAFLATHNSSNIKAREKILTKLRRDVFDNLINGQLDSLLENYNKHTSSFSMAEFYEDILLPVMYKIGDLWEKKQLSIAVEHVASNVAHGFVKILNEGLVKTSTKQKILICTPPGEFHNLGCNMLESYLVSRGFQVYNLSPSIPTEEIIGFLKENQADSILISITLEENIQSGKRLVEKIKTKFKIPIFVGGLALSNKKNDWFGATNASNLRMKELAKTLSIRH